MTNKDTAGVSRRATLKLSLAAAAGLGLSGTTVAKEESRTFVLVPGAWHGGWVWRDLAPMLRDKGHVATAPTLTGLGERKHILNDVADLSTHIEDIVSHIEMEGLENVDLVGWSYAGMVIAGVHARIPEKIRSLIYLDAFVPEDGKSLYDYVGGPSVAAYDAAKRENRAAGPIPLKIFGVKNATVEKFVEPRLVGQPWRTFFEPVKTSPELASVPTTFILCTGWKDRSPFGQFEEKMIKQNARIIKIPTSHLCMLTDPEETLDALTKAL